MSATVTQLHEYEPPVEALWTRLELKMVLHSIDRLIDKKLGGYNTRGADFYARTRHQLQEILNEMEKLEGLK